MANTVGAAYTFDGTSGSSYINYGTFLGLSGANVLSASAWVNFNSLGSTDNQLVAGQWASGGFDAWWFGVENNGYFLASVREYNSPGTFQWGTTVKANTIVTTNEWFHLLIVWGGTNVQANARLYINGVSQTLMFPNNDVVTSLVTNQPYTVGCLSSSFNVDNLNGQICHLGLWNIALTANQVQEIYNSTPLAIQTGLVSYLPLIDAAAIDRVTGTTPTIGSHATQSTSGPQKVFYHGGL